MALEFVEDFIEFLYGTLDKEGVPSQTFGYSNNTKIKLATYDRNPVASMGAYCAKARLEKLDVCLTDKQIGLAKTIIFKYRRQFQNLGISLPEKESDLILRHGLRAVDRTKSIKFDETSKKIFLKFPYDPKKISALHDYTTHSAGNVEWKNVERHWEFDYTEGNIKKILDLFSTEDISIDESLTPAVTEVLKASSADLPRIKLNNTTIELVNCHPKVLEYLASKNFNTADIDNLSYWVSLAVSLGLQVDETIISYLSSITDSMTVNLLTNRIVTLPSKNQTDGPWYDTLVNSNRILKNCNWVLFLSWWTHKTNWDNFENMIRYSQEEKNTFKIEKKFADLLLSLDNPVVIMDSVIGKEAVRNFIESYSLKVIYISDIGNL